LPDEPAVAQGLDFSRLHAISWPEGGSLLARCLGLGFLIVLIAQPAFSQNSQRLSTVNTHGWYNYFGDHPVSESWGAHLEAQWRRHDVITQWQQLLLRPAINFSANKNVVFTAGYAFVDTFAYGDFPVRHRFPEHRMYEQVVLKHELGKLGLQHRYRLEQRYLGQKIQPSDSRIDSWRYENRFRYMMRMNVPLGYEKKLYLGVYDEIMVNFGNNVAANIFDQNRAYAALGYSLSKNTKLEIGYLLQTLQQRNGRVIEYNNTFQLSVFSTVPFLRSK
jgi:Protein of unknown function (DUF2490)